MVARKRNWKNVKATSVSHAMELCLEYAETERRSPMKVLEDKMGIQPKQLSAWNCKTSMPLNKIRQFEEFCGVSFISDYLCMANGNKIVVTIPTGKKAEVMDIAEVQRSFADAIALLARFYHSGDALEETVAALTTTLSQLAFQRSNVIKVEQPELELFGE